MAFDHINLELSSRDILLGKQTTLLLIIERNFSLMELPALWVSTQFQQSFSGRMRQRSPMRTAGNLLKLFDLCGVYGGNYSRSSGPDINTGVVLVNLS